MNISIQLSIHEIMTISSDIFNYLHDQTRKYRIPINILSIISITINAAIIIIIINVNVNIDYLKSFYTYLFGHAKVTIDHAIEVNSLLDNGLEFNMML